MNGTVRAEQNGVHGVATRLKRTRINNRTRAERIDTGLGRLGLGNALDFFLFGLSVVVDIVLIVKKVANFFINIKHHNVQDTIGIQLQRLGTNGVIGNEDEPMVGCDWTKSVPTPIQTLAKIAVAVKVVQLLMEGLVRELLVSRKIEILSAVSDPIDFQAHFTTKFNKQSNAAEQSCGTTGFQDDHVRIHKEGGFRQNIRIEVLVGNTGQNRAPSTSANAAQMIAREATKADRGTGACHDGSFFVDFAETNL
mmetsp:Transcript_37638/g.58306  ORF Transcript_37638/g.58306 Transcript_37638/m.58306 type:complete len:252 (-) Transcript_37638:492-1247(-)